MKSLPGPHREWEQGIERDEDRGLDPTGRTRNVTVKSANDALREALPLVRRAMNQLQRKTTAETSRNVFLVVHPLDHIVIECINHEVIGPLLDPMEGVDDLKSVWVLWLPITSPCGRRTIMAGSTCCLELRRWRSTLPRPPNQLAVLQEAETEFLARIGYAGGSPYRFSLSPE